MYRIALIQNESEMMRYSWADIRPMVHSLGYAFDSYTAENLDDLPGRLNRNRYDALFIASNACNDRLVLESLTAAKEEIARFLERGGGILVCFQMKLAGNTPYPFMPPHLGVTATNRIPMKERPEVGRLACGREQSGNVILTYPHRIDLGGVEMRCLRNDMVKGLYWTYLEASSPGDYVTVIEDSAICPSRSLLLSSRLDSPSRVVVTSLALDWQSHGELWENAARFVVEGKPTIAVISREGCSSFDYRFLVSTLEVKKLPHAEYTLQEMDPSAIPLDIHTSYILDPAWSEDDVALFTAATTDLIRAGVLRVFSFGQTKSGLPYLTAASNVREYQAIAGNALTWLVSSYPEDPDETFWGGSFWCTVEVLRTLVQFGMPVDHYASQILKGIYPHDQDGSYDEVLGASCAMLEVYVLFLGRDDERSQRCLRWILAYIDEKDLFEQATAYDILTGLGFSPETSRLRAFRERVVQSATQDNEFQIYRFAKTLLVCGFTRDAERLARRLHPLQDQETGRWVNVPHTASVVGLLVGIQDRSGNPDPELDEMLFRGVQFLRATYDPPKISWNEDLTATAKCLNALRAFEQKLNYPVDVVSTALQSAHKEALHADAMDVAMAMGVKLQSQVNDLQSQAAATQAELEESAKSNGFASRLSAALASISVLVLCLGALFAFYADRAGIWGAIGRHLAAFLREQGPIVISAVVFLAANVLFLILARLGQAPRIRALLGSLVDRIRGRDDG